MPKYRRKKNQSKGKGNKKSNNNKQISQATKQNNSENRHAREEHLGKSVESSPVTTISTGVLPEQQQNEKSIDKKEIDLIQQSLQTVEQQNINVVAGCCNKESEICVCKSSDNDTRVNISRSTVVSSESNIQNFSHFTDCCEVNKSLNVHASSSGVSTIDKTGAKNSTEKKGEEPSFVEQSHQYHQSLENTLQDVEEVKEANINGTTTSVTIPEPSSPISISSSSSSDSDTLKPSDTDSPDREILLTVGMMPLIDDNNRCIDDDVIHVNTSNLPICDNKNAARATIEPSDNSDHKIGEADSCSNNKIRENEVKHSIDGPVKFPIVKEVISISYPYRVESPKPMKPETGTTSKIKKSRSLDDDEVMIQEMSDNSSAGDSTDNQPIVSEAESEIDFEVNDIPTKDNLNILSIQTLPLDSMNRENSQAEELRTTQKPIHSQSTLTPENEDFKIRRAKKRAALESHFLPQFLNPRYLDSIKEEGSDLSDVEKKSDSGEIRPRREKSKSCSDLEDDVFNLDNETILKKANAVFPKSNLDFSQKKKHTSNLRAPKTGVIREESPCYIVEAKIVEQTIPPEENCFVWSTETVAQTDAAEVIYLDSASSSSSDIMDLDNTGADDADIEDLNDDADVRIATPNIDIADGERRIFRKSETPTIATDESVSTSSFTEAEFSDDAIRNEYRPPVEWEINATENIFNDDNFHHSVENEISGGDSIVDSDHEHHHSDQIEDQSLSIQSDIISEVIKNCLFNQSQNISDQLYDNTITIPTNNDDHNHVTSSSSSSQQNLKLVEVNQHESDRKNKFKILKSDQKNEVNIKVDEFDLDAQNELRLSKIKEIASKCIEEIVNECEQRVNNKIRLDTKENSSAITNTPNKRYLIENIPHRLAEVSTYVSANESTTVVLNNHLNSEVHNNKDSDYSNLNNAKAYNETLTTDLDAIETEHRQIENKKLVEQFLKQSQKCCEQKSRDCVIQKGSTDTNISQKLMEAIEKSSNKTENDKSKPQEFLFDQDTKNTQDIKQVYNQSTSNIEKQTPPTPNEMSENSLLEPNLVDIQNSTSDQLTCSNNIDINHSLTENNLNNNIIEYNRQDSSGSHCSDHSHSTEHSQCTAINRGSSSNIDLDIGKYVSDASPNFELKVSENTSETATIETLRHLCVEKLASMPYGNVVLEELALVAESLSNLTSKHQRAKLTEGASSEMPYPLPELPRINGLEVSGPTSEIHSKIRLSSLPPDKLRSPPPPPIPELPKDDAWLGVPTHEDPKVIVCFSPSQRNYLEETKSKAENTADNLLDMHKKFIQRRGYHELTTEQVDEIHREKSQQNYEKNVVSSNLRNGIGAPLSSSSTPHSHSQQSPLAPPPPLPRSCRLSYNESEIAAKVKNDDKNNHRLLAIIRDSKQSSSSENTSRKIEQVVKLPSEIQTKDNYRCDQEIQTVPNTNTLENTKGKSSEQKKISSSSAPIEIVKNITNKKETMPMNIAGEEYFKLGDGDIFNTERKRFSNIETTPYYCSQLRQTLPKRYSNIETSSYESKKRIENGNVVYEYSDSSKNKIVDGSGDNKEKGQTDSRKKSHDGQIMSDINLDTNLRSSEAPKSKSDSESFSQKFKNRETDIKHKTSVDELSYEEFRQRAKESAKKARNEFFDRENFFKGYDDISKYFGDYLKEKKFTNASETTETLKTHTIPIKIENTTHSNKENENTKIYKQGKEHITTVKDEKVYEIPIIVEGQRSVPSNKSVPKKAISEQNIFRIPITLEENLKSLKANKGNKFQRTQSLSQDHYNNEKLQEKRLSSHNLDEWMRFTNEFGASSENITKPFQKEVEMLYKGRPSNVKAPRLSVSTSNLATETKKDYYRPSSRTDHYHFSSSQSSIDQTPITCYVSPRFPKRSSLPREVHGQQMDYIKMKEMELQAEFDKLENERRKLIEEMDIMRKSPQLQQSTLRKDVLHHRSCKLPTLTEEEAFRQQMHDEWLNKVAEREERRLHKIIKISKPSEDLTSEPHNQNERRKSSSALDISDEFLKRVKERRSKLCMPSDSDWESGAESHPNASKNGGNENSENESSVKVIEGQTETNLNHLPRHLREFAEFTSKTIEKDEEHSSEQKEHKEEHFTSIIKDESSKTMSKVTSTKTTTESSEQYKSNNDAKTLLHAASSSSATNVDNKDQQDQQKQHQHQHQQQSYQPGVILRSKKQSQSTQTTITTTRKKQTKFILSPNRRSWSESDLLKEIDKELVLSKGFLFGHGVWSPTNKSSEPSVTESQVQQQHPLASKNQCPTPPPPPSQPIWSPQPSPTTGRKEFRPVRFESPNLPRRYVRQDSAPVAPPWSYTDSKPFLGYQTASTSCTNLNTSSDPGYETNLFKTKINSNSANSLIQKTKESLFGKGGTPKIETPPIARPNEVIYKVKHEYMSEPESEYEQPRKMAQLGRRQYEGIGPTTKDGMPIVLRSEVKENNQHKWYKRMYNTLHKAKDHDDYVTIRYKTRRGRYPYKSNGYMSEPEPNYDSDYSTMKYHTFERSRYTPSSGTAGTTPTAGAPPATTTTYYDDRNYGTMPNPVKSGSPSYKNQPGRIENYVPGHSSVSEKERKEQLEQQKLSSSYTEGYLSRALKEQGYESDSNLIFRKKGDSQISPLSPVEQKQAYKNVQAGGEPPLQGFRKPAPEKPRESSRRYVEGDVNIHYKTPIRYEYKDSIPDEELARRQAETMKKLYQEERRRKYLQELQDMNKRRHTDNFTPSQKSPIPLNRYDDFITDVVTPKSPNTTYPRTVARALFNFQGQTARELTFKKGDVIYIRRQIDKNWYEGEHNAMVGLLPANYVEIITKDGVRQPPKKPSEGQARAKFNFSAQSAIELSLNKGELVILTRRVDENWFEGRIANRKGIFPVSYVEVLTDIGSEDNIQQPIQSKPVGAPASHSLITYPNQTSSNLDTLRTNINNEFSNLTNGHPANTILRETKSIHKTEVLHVDTNSEPIPYRALYKYRPQNNDELELQEGDIVYVLEKCDDGWYVGTSQRTGYFGTFPGNYVEKV